MLEQEGLVRVEPGRGVRVVSGDIPTLLAAYEVRRVIDGLAARLAAREASRAEIIKLQKTIEAQERALSPWDASAYTAANVEFHGQIMKMSGNEFVMAQTPILRMTAQVFTPVAVVGPRRAEMAVTQHREVYDAIAARAPEVAEPKAMAHIQATIDSVRAFAGYSKPLVANTEGGD